MVAAAVALMGSTSAYAQSAPWTISEASGRVVIRDSAGDHAGARGATVPAGATVMTGTTGRAILVRGQDFVTLSANARMRLPGAAQAGGLFQMIQEWGNALFRIEHRKDPHFGVQAPYLAAVVKGTTFSVTVTREGSSVQVIEGAVEAATADGGAHELVRPGAVASVMASDRFRLTVQGQNAHSIDSPARGRAGSSAPVAPPAPNGASAGGGDRNDAGAVDTAASSYDDIAWQQVANSVVAAPIEAKPADLGKITDGLVSGKSNGTAVASAVAVARAETSGGSGNGAGSALSGGNGNGSSAGTSSGNGSGSGNSGASGAGNGNSAGSGSDASGNGSGASGNGNGTGVGSGNGDSGNGNSGNGNGGGNGNSGAGSGNGGGNGNSGNGNSDGGGNGNGSGNGNGGKPRG